MRAARENFTLTPEKDYPMFDETGASRPGKRQLTDSNREQPAARRIAFESIESQHMRAVFPEDVHSSQSDALKALKEQATLDRNHTHWLNGVVEGVYNDTATVAASQQQ